MSAVDFVARGLAQRAVISNPLLFSDLALAQLPGATTTVQTAGYSTAGRGAAVYVCDALANAALMAAHPLAVFCAADGRYFRLRAGDDGMITPEQMGSPAYTPGVNQQPFVQAALNYCKALGLRGVQFPEASYELWAPLRTRPYASGRDAITDSTNHSGNFLVIDRWDCFLLGTASNKTTFYFKGPTGGSQLDDYQVFATTTYGGDVIWRGSAIKLTGTVGIGFARPNASQMSHARIQNIRFFSDCVGTRNTNWPAFPPSRDPTRVNCWDITHKGLYYQ